MIKLGNTIVIKNENGTLGFFWLCDRLPDAYIFYDWYGNIHRPSPSDFLRVSKDWINGRLAMGTLEIFTSLPLDKYGDIFEAQARERNK